MNIIKTVKFVYVIYTIYIFMAVSVTTMSFFDIVPGVFLMWVCYILFSLGFSHKVLHAKKRLISHNGNNWLINQKRFSLFLIASLSMISSILAVRYYTGQTPISVVQNLLSGTSLYLQYQYYFRVNSIGVFTLGKLPYIIMLIFIKFILVYSYISYSVFKSKIRIYEKLYLFIVTFSSVYVGIARGTNFEFFELFVLVFFITFINNKRKLSLSVVKSRLSIVLLASFMIFVFYSGVAARGMEFSDRISGDIYFNPDGIIPFISNFVSFVIILVFDYFGFGFFYISKYISNVWIASESNFIGGFFPLGTLLLSAETILDQMKNTIDMGARWHPDIVVIINDWGLIGLLVFCFILGRFSRFIKNQIIFENNSAMIYITLYFILMQMIALPVGNFIQVSSANKMIVLVLGLIWGWKWLKLPIRIR